MPDELHSYRLDNGLEVLLAPHRLAPVVAIQAWVGVGSADETPDQAGIAHVFEHMLFKGTGRRGIGEIAATIEAAGGDINAWTSFNQTVFHVVLASRYLDTGLDVLADALQRSSFDDGELAREREVVLEEIRQGADDPVRNVALSLFSTAYVIHPYRRPVIGSADTVRAMRRDHLVDFFRTWYVADNTTLVVAGDFDVGAAERAIARHFGAMPSGPVRRTAVVEPPQVATRGTVITQDVTESYLAIGFHAPPLRSDDTAALDLAAIVLGQGESSRLATTVRRDQELVSGVYAYVHSLRDAGMLVVSATARPERAREATEAIFTQLARIADGDISEAEIDKARGAIEADQIYQRETAQGLARKYGWYRATAGDAAWEREYVDRIRAATAVDVRAAAHRYLDLDRATIAAVVPTGSLPRTERARHTEAQRLIASARRGVQVAQRARRKRRPDVVREVLPNGLRVLVKRDPSVPVVAMRAVWPGGVRLETARSNGVTTLLANVITRGCGDLDGDQLAERVDRMAGSLSGVGGRNSFGLRAEWLAKSWEQGLDLLADCIVAPRFDAAEIARERRRLLDELEAQRDSASHLAFRAFAETLYRKHPYRLDILGAPASVASLGRKQLVDFYRDHFPVSGMTLAIVGDVDPERVLARIRARFADQAARKIRGGVPAREDFAARALTDREVYRYLDREQAHLVVGFPGTTVSANDRFALEVLTTILGGQSGRLFVELRDRQSLAYRVSAFSVEGLDPGYVAVYLACGPDKLDAALAGVRRELDRVVADGVTAAEVERATRYLIGAHEISLQRRAAVATALAFHEAYDLGWDQWSRYPERIAKITAADVQRAARRFLDWDLAVTATVRPTAMSPGAAKRARGVVKKAKPPVRRHPRPTRVRRPES